MFHVTHNLQLYQAGKEGDANDLTDEDEDDEYIFDSEFSFSSDDDDEHGGQVNGKSYDPCTGFYGMDREGNANYEPETTDGDDDEDDEDEDSVDKDSYLASNKLPQVECTSIRKLDEDHHLYYNNQANHVSSNTSNGGDGGYNKSNCNNTGLSNGKCMPNCERSNYSNNNNCDVKSKNNYSAPATNDKEDRRPHLFSTKLPSKANKCSSSNNNNNNNSSSGNNNNNNNNKSIDDNSGASAATITSTAITSATTTATTTTTNISNGKVQLNHQELFHQQLTQRLQLQRNKLQKCLNQKSESTYSLKYNNNNDYDNSSCSSTSLKEASKSLYENIANESNLLYNSCIELCDGKGDRKSNYNSNSNNNNNKEKTISTHDLKHVSSIQPSSKLNNEKGRDNSTTLTSPVQLNMSSISHATCNSTVETDEVMKCRENSVKVTCEKNEKPLKPPKPPGLSSLPSLVNTVVAKNTLRRKTQRPSVQPPPPP